MVSDRARAFLWDEKGYGFVGWDGRQWRAETGEALERHRLPGGMRLQPKAPAQPAPLGIDGMGMPFAVRLESADAHWLIVYDGLNAIAMPAPVS